MRRVWGGGEEKRASLFEAAPARGPGWSLEALEAGATDLRMPHEEMNGLLASPVESGDNVQRIAVELVHYFVRRSNTALAKDPSVVAVLDRSRHDPDDPPQSLIAGRVKTIARARLNMLEPYIEDGRWLEAMALGALPENANDTGRLVLETVDEIWHVAGDQSMDAKRYTRRLGLLPGYCATELFMLTDESPGRQETWDFLDWHVDALFGGDGETDTAGESERQQGPGNVYGQARVEPEATERVDEGGGEVPHTLGNDGTDSGNGAPPSVENARTRGTKEENVIQGLSSRAPSSAGMLDTAIVMKVLAAWVLRLQWPRCRSGFLAISALNYVWT